MAVEQVERVVVTVDDAYLPTIQALATALEGAGLRVTNVLATVGIITGEVSRLKIHSLEALPGVAAVELDQEMRAI